jgi:hypothetical protein
MSEYGNGLHLKVPPIRSSRSGFAVGASSPSSPLTAIDDSLEPNRFTVFQKVYKRSQAYKPYVGTNLDVFAFPDYSITEEQKSKIAAMTEDENHRFFVSHTSPSHSNVWNNTFSEYVSLGRNGVNELEIKQGSIRDTVYLVRRNILQEFVNNNTFSLLEVSGPLVAIPRN